MKIVTLPILLLVANAVIADVCSTIFVKDYVYGFQTDNFELIETISDIPHGGSQNLWEYKNNRISKSISERSAGFDTLTMNFETADSISYFDSFRPDDYYIVYKPDRIISYRFDHGSSLYYDTLILIGNNYELRSRELYSSAGHDVTNNTVIKTTDSLAFKIIDVKTHGTEGNDSTYYICTTNEYSCACSVSGNSVLSVIRTNENEVVIDSIYFTGTLNSIMKYKLKTETGLSIRPHYIIQKNNNSDKYDLLGRFNNKK